jgi:hypothetical protein
MTERTPLYKRLQRQPTAPKTDFDRFVVGAAASGRATLLALLRRMLSCTEPTSGRLILGLNGNGKTLLNNALQEEATKHNLAERGAGGRPTFDVMFSRVSASHAAISSLGVELAKGLSRSYLEPPEITYASIAAEILRRFTDTYKSPLTTRLLTAPAKVLLKYALKKYDEYIGDLLESGAEEVTPAGVDEVFRQVDRGLRRLGLERNFQAYARSQRMGKFLEEYVGGRRDGFRTVAELNRLLHDDLAASFSSSQPQDIVRCLAEMARSVGTKVLILQVDDCNDKNSVDFLLPIADQFSTFTNPKVLLIASAVEGAWQESIERGADKSLLQKVQIFFNPITLPSPTQQELIELANKLETLIQNEVAGLGHSLDWPREAREAALDRCVGSTYRICTKILIDDAEKYISMGAA